MHKPSKIISGGQSGADLGGLVAAQAAQIPTGGTAPKDFRTETGLQQRLLQGFGLTPHQKKNYQARTKQNVIDADATLIIATMPESAGTQLTIKLCQALVKPYLLVNPDKECDAHIRDFLNVEKPAVLNIAGNRESRSPGIFDKTVALLGFLKCKVDGPLETDGRTSDV